MDASNKFEIVGVERDVVHGIQTQICLGCEIDEPTLFCVQCNAKYCQECDSKAHQTKNTKLHRRTALGNQFCSSHVGEKLELFCFECKINLCILCKDYGLHKEHEVESFEVAAPRLRDDIRIRCDAVGLSLEHAGKLKAQLDQTSSQLSGKSLEIVKEEINSHIDAIAVALNDRKNEILAQIDALATEHHNALLNQAQSLTALVNYSTSSINSAKKLSVSNDYELAFKFHECSSILESLIVGAKPALNPVVDSCIPLQLSSDLKGAISQFGVVGGPFNLHFGGDLKRGNGEIRWYDHTDADGRWRPDAFRVKLRVIEAVDGPVSWFFRQTISAAPGFECIISDRVPSGINYREVYSLPFSINRYVGCTIECYVQAYDNLGRSSPWIVTPEKITIPEVLVAKKFRSHHNNFDSHGLLHWLGCREGLSAYSNPYQIGAVEINASSLGQGSGDLSLFVSYFPVFNESCYTDNTPQSWMGVDIGPNRLIRPTAYSLRHDAQSGRGVLRNWVFQGKPSGRHEDSWVTISTHDNDKSLAEEAASTALFRIDSEDVIRGYRFFRILQTGPNSTGKDRLYCSGIELYGDLYC
jgi:hypothetical protein